MLHCHLPHHMMNQMSSLAGRMTRTGRGQMPAGNSMNNGMGMLDGSPGAPLGEEYGPSLGRGLGSDSDMTYTNGPLSDPKLDASMEGMMQQMPAMMQKKHTGEIEMGPLQMRNMMAMKMDMCTIQQQEREATADADNVPNFPQDNYMEGPMMTMDSQVAKPENYRLRPGWSRFMQGMMTFVRVLPSDQYDDVIARMKRAGRPNDPYASLLQRSEQA
jgi:hypothetical protein